jgi:tellurite resistance protein
MITVPIWQILLAMFLTDLVSFFFGAVVMACVAMAGYDGDEQRSEPE